MVKAVTYSSFGEPDVLEVVDLPLDTAPLPPGRVAVRVHALSVNPIDWKLRKGLMSKSAAPAKPTRTGRDLAGVVEAIGPDVTEFEVGDRVAGNVNGGASAEVVVVRVGELTGLPDNVDFPTGASVGVAGTTAIRVLTLAEVGRGTVLLLHGAAGGVGSFTAQLAVARGATVIGTSGEQNHDFVRSLGAVPVTYGAGWEDRVRAAATGPITAVIDTAGAGVIEGSLRLVEPGSPIITIADFNASGPGVVVTQGGEPGFENALRDAVEAVANGQVQIPIETTFPLEKLADAHRLSETRHLRGKIVVTV
jgi:NADPH:quinone reductase-like Zn-dependent oxidoreductase